MSEMVGLINWKGVRRGAILFTAGFVLLLVSMATYFMAKGYLQSTWTTVIMALAYLGIAFILAGMIMVIHSIDYKYKSETVEEKFLHLEELLATGKINQEEYEMARKSIIQKYL
ncbi:hypothetical protein B6U71_01555 [Euryarchaeota archaeon ex4484_178]|nr:MAG: hypothetical protein B6U71_01555 [Euryarchaeota archaeon ex4484_178]